MGNDFAVTITTAPPPTIVSAINKITDKIGINKPSVYASSYWHFCYIYTLCNNIIICPSCIAVVITRYINSSPNRQIKSIHLGIMM